MFVSPLVPLATLLAVAPVNPPEGSWLAWHGCWRTVGDDAPEQVICILPGADPAEARLRIVDQGTVTEQTLARTDGTPRTVQEGGCTGTETGRWSRDGRRVFIRAELDCDGVRRVSNAVFAVVAENEWIDVQTVTVAEQHLSRVRRYRAITGSSMPTDIRAALDDGRQLVRESARLQAAAPLEIEDVIEALSHLPPAGVEALLAARQHGFGLNARKLVQLEEARVPASVIDVMVALSYPQRFAVRDRAETRSQPAYQPGTAEWGDDYFDCYDSSWNYRRGVYRNRYGSSCYDRYGYGWGSRYDPWYGGYGWGGGPVVIIPRGNEPDDETPREPGQAVKGRGYTRGTGENERGTARPRSSTRSSDGSPRPQPSVSSGGSRPSSGGSTSSGGSSGGGSSTGRTAKPRGGGSN